MNSKTIKTMLILSIITMNFFCNKDKDKSLNAPGIVNGEVITVRAKASGTITALNFYEAKKVKENEILLKIDSRIIKNKLDAIPLGLKSIDYKIKELKQTANYIYANRAYLIKQLKRFKRLYKKKSISGDKLEKLQLQLKKASVEYFNINQKILSLNLEKEKLLNNKENLELLLENFTVKSPSKGIIIEKFVSKGENILPAQPIADILDENSLYIEVFIEGKETARLKTGDKVNIYLDGLNEKQTGTISYFGKKAEFSPKYVVSEKERKALLYLVKIKIDKHKEYYKLGMPLTVSFNNLFNKLK